MAAVLQVESSFNAFAIGVVGGRLQRQPTNLAEAVVTAKALDAAGYNFSLGIGQINRHNLAKYGLDYQRAFEPCANLRAASLILQDCYVRAKTTRLDAQTALRAAFSCYYSGNFSAGFRPDHPSQTSYVQKVLASVEPLDAAKRVQPIHVMPLATSNAKPFIAMQHVIRVTAAVARREPVTVKQPEGKDDLVTVYR